MTFTEFDTWWEDYAVRFPETLSWMNSLGDKLKHRTKSSWAEILDDVELNEAREATRRMAKGDEQPIRAFERDTTATHVRTISLRLRHERSLLSQSEQDRYRYKRPDKKGRLATGNLAKALQRVEELCKDGAMSPASATEQVVHEMPDAFPEDDYYSQRRYKCLRCQDCGTLEVWTGKAAMLAKEDKLTGREGGLLASLFCDCVAGDRGDSPKTKVVRFNKHDFCECPHGHTTSIENRVAFVQWLETRRPRNYDGTFDTWNNT